MFDPTAHELWFSRPADAWTEALPLGNGRTGAMVFGRVQSELIRLNDSTAWSGSPASAAAGEVISSSEAKEALTEARQAITDNDFGEAETQLKRLQHRYSQSYLPLADLHLGFGHSGVVSDYRRSLKLLDAIHTTSYLLDGHGVTIDSFVSHPDGVLVVEIETDHPDGLDIHIALDSQLRTLSAASNNDLTFLELKLPADVAPSHDIVDVPVTWSNHDSLSLQAAVVALWSHDGATAEDMRAVHVHRARLVLATATTFTSLGQPPVGDAVSARENAEARVRAAMGRTPTEVRARHFADHGALYKRAELSTGEGRDLPLDARLNDANADPKGVLEFDPSMVGLLYNYGRYLLIASSRPGGPPANLQGIWNDLMQPPWSSNYTTNINLQMNYWQAEVAQLAECAEPLYDLIDLLASTGAETARRLYSAPGWVAHHNTDIWGYSEPVGLGVADPKWAFWPLAGPWLVRHLWERLQFGADDNFARGRVWAPVRSAAEFCLAWLREAPDGTLSTSPSTSPENQFLWAGGVHSVAESSTLDFTLIADLFDILIELAKRLGITDDPVVAAASRVRPRIPDPAVAENGQVREWAADLEDADPLHRHLSPLYFLHPGDREVNTELAAASSRTLDVRGDESTGWSLVWKIAMRARLRERGKVADLLALVFRNMEVDRGEWVGGLYTNLLAAHPPFQIDGNFGFVAGISEALVQSHRGEIELLPAVPPVLATGSIRGLMARPGVEVSISWADGKLVQASFRKQSPKALGQHVVRLGAATVLVDLTAESVVTLTGRDFN